jgi:hypothetical protein
VVVVPKGFLGGPWEINIMAQNSSPTKNPQDMRIGEEGMEKAKEATTQAVEKARQVAGAVGQTADRGISAAGSGMRNLGENIRDYGPRSGALGNAARNVGNSLEQGGSYLESTGLNGLTEGCAHLIREYPIGAMISGIGIGFMIGLTLRTLRS